MYISAKSCYQHLVCKNIIPAICFVDISCSPLNPSKPPFKIFIEKASDKTINNDPCLVLSSRVIYKK